MSIDLLRGVVAARQYATAARSGGLVLLHHPCASSPIPIAHATTAHYTWQPRSPPMLVRRLSNLLSACMCIFVTTALTHSTAAQPTCATGWQPGPEIAYFSGSINAMTKFDPDGPGSQVEMLVLGGAFTRAGTTAAKSVAAWDGMRWRGFGEGLNDIVCAFASFNGQLIAGGLFSASGPTVVNGVARWDGQAWRTMGTGLTSASTSVHALAVYNGDLYAGGTFLGGLRRWSGTSWVQATGWSAALQVDHLAVYNGELIASGPYYAPMRWDGMTWRSFAGLTGSPASSRAPALGVVQGRLMITGTLSLNGVQAPALSWDGQSFTSLPSLGGQVYGFSEFASDPVAFGLFDQPSPYSAVGAARLAAGTWQSFGQQTFGLMETLGAAEYQGRMYFGGPYGLRMFSSSRPTYVTSLLPIDGWASLPRSIVSFGGAVLCNAGFAFSSGAATGKISGWNGRSFFDVPVPFVYNLVNRLAVDGEDLLVFPAPGGQIVRSHAGAWSPDASIAPVGFQFTDFTRWNGAAVSTGWFSDSSQPSFPPVGRVYIDDGTGLRQLGQDLAGSLGVVAVANGTPYVAGSFAAVPGGAQPPDIARWDGSAWQPMAAGFSGGYVLALQDFQGLLVAGGSFTQIAGVTTPYIVSWDGLRWRALGAGLPAPVTSMDVSSGALVASYGTSTTGGISPWDGTAWTPIFPNLNGGITGFTTYGNETIAIGGFTGTGNIVSGWFARYTQTGLPVITMVALPGHPICGGTARFTINHTGAAPLTYQWRRNGAPLVDGPTPSGSTVSGATSPNLALANCSPTDQGRYDCLVVNACGQTTSTPGPLSLCIANFNCVGGVTVQDVFDFLIAYFSGSAAADINAIDGVTIQDIFDFLIAYFSGCP